MIRTRNNILNGALTLTTPGLISAAALAAPPTDWPAESFLADAPEGFIPPPLHPGSTQPRIRQLGDACRTECARWSWSYRRRCAP